MDRRVKDLTDFYFNRTPKNWLNAEQMELELERIDRFFYEINANKDFMDDEIFKKICEDLAGLSIFYKEKSIKKRILNEKN